VRRRMTVLRTRLQRLLLWRAWERMLEIEFVDRSVALAGKAFVSFFPLVIVVAAFASSDDVRKATGLLGLVLAILFASSFTTALQRVYLHAWRRPPRAGAGAHWRGVIWLLVMLASFALLGALRAALDGGLEVGLFVIVSLGLWWFTA